MKFTHLLLYPCYTQEWKIFPQISCHHRKSLPIPDQVFVASSFAWEVSCLSHSLCPQLRGLVMHRVTGAGVGSRTCGAREGVPD